MTAARDWYPGRLRELQRPECLELVATRSVGRVAFCTPDGPIVLPVTYTLDGDEVVFRTAPHNIIARNVQGRPTTFEVDEIDDFTQSGWSVLIQGTGEFVDSVEDLSEEARPTPWAEGIRTLFIKVVPRQVSGRRLFPS
jgi:nitroimidazol reductase NimA-like FMN-containing flavoprotein (pyridoxamine 5'-phosphate oxidase superfamily)